jgi:hypothetical protein
MALEALEGTMVFLGGVVVFVDFFCVAGRLWGERAGALMKFGDFEGFWWIFGEFRVV